MHEETAKNRRLKLAGLAVVVVTLLAGCFWIVSHGELVLEWTMDAVGVERGKPESHYIPEGYTGWVTATYDVAGAPALPQRDGAVIFEYDESGRLETSSGRNDGVKRQAFFSIEDGRQVELQVAGRGEEFLIGDPPAGEKRIWHTYTARYAASSASRGRQVTGFFVGTKQQYDAAEPPLPWLRGPPSPGGQDGNGAIDQR